MNEGLVKINKHGVIELANKRFVQMFGLDSSLVESNVTSLSDVKKVLQDRGGIIKVIAGESSPNLAECMPFTQDIYELNRSDGWAVEVRTVPLVDGGIIRTYSDISARREAESAVHESEARYRRLADTTLPAGRDGRRTAVGVDPPRGSASGGRAGEGPRRWLRRR